MTCWRWYLSICACRLSRRASRSWFWGLRSVTTLSTPAQKLSGSTSVPGSASLLMKSYNTWATRRFPTVTRLVMRDPPSRLARWSFVLPKAVDPAYPGLTGVMPKAVAFARFAVRRREEQVTPIRQGGPQRCGPFSNALLGTDVLGATRRRLDGDRLESVVAEIIGAGTHIQRTGVGGECQAIHHQL